VTSLQLEIVLKQNTIGKRIASAHSSAYDFDSMYRNMLKRIQESDESEVAMRILMWVLFSIRPLSSQELRYAVAIQPGMVDFNARHDLPPGSFMDSC